MTELESLGAGLMFAGVQTEYWYNGRGWSVVGFRVTHVDGVFKAIPVLERWGRTFCADDVGDGPFAFHIDGTCGACCWPYAQRPHEPFTCDEAEHGRTRV